MGGIAALYAGAAYVVGMMGFLLIVGWPDDPVKQVAVLVDNQVIQHILYLIVYQVWAVFLVVLALALYERLKADSPAMMQTATAIGMIWACVVIASGMIFNIGMDTVVDLYGTDPAQATTVWLVIESVCDGIGGGNEILGGLWVLLLSWVALQAGGLPRALNYLGVVIGVAGIISALPGLGEVGMIFGLGQIVWFVWLGIVMLRSSPSAAA
ncbi:MAG: DUF4386 domain-containing protein [Chloroflexi bacterium]|nr:DUF4386 domain-containing protein [Chloroflexota bacterium]